MAHEEHRARRQDEKRHRASDRLGVDVEELGREPAATASSSSFSAAAAAAAAAPTDAESGRRPYSNALGGCRGEQRHPSSYRDVAGAAGDACSLSRVDHGHALDHLFTTPIGHTLDVETERYADLADYAEAGGDGQLARIYREHSRCLRARRGSLRGDEREETQQQQQRQEEEEELRRRYRDDCASVAVVGYDDGDSGSRHLSVGAPVPSASSFIGSGAGRATSERSRVGKAVSDAFFNSDQLAGKRHARSKRMQRPLKFAERQERLLRHLRGERSAPGFGSWARRAPPLLKQCVAEFVGTFILIIFGLGAVVDSVTTAWNAGLWQVAMMWWAGVAFGVYAAGSISGGHLNPAVTLGFAVWRPLDFPWRKLPAYWLAQLLGAMAGAAFNLMVFHAFIDFFNAQQGATARNEPAALLTASAFGEYIPNPGFAANGGGTGVPWPDSIVSPWFGVLVEAVYTAALFFMILVFTDARNQTFVRKDLSPFMIGFVVAALVVLAAPITQACFNPARDFGPRLVAAMAGWKGLALPGPRRSFWIYLVGPLLGSPIGGLLYDVLIGSALATGT